MLSQTIAHYRIQRPLGVNSIGTVYLAEDLRLRRRVVLMLLPESFVSDAGRMRQFSNEARILSALNHPHIRFIYEVGQDGAQHYLAAEYVEGPNLREHLARTRLALSEAIAIALQLASGLAAAHAAGVLHHDLRPENVVIHADGYVKILDFGLAKLAEQPVTTATEVITATDRTEPLDAYDPFQTAPLSHLQSPDAPLDATEPTIALALDQQPAQPLWWSSQGTAYLSPEQVRGAPVDERSDIFSFGVLFYELCAGRIPFDGLSKQEVLEGILTGPYTPLLRALPDAPEELEWIVAKALAKAPAERYQTIKECLSDLRRLQQRLEFAAEQQRQFETRAVEQAPEQFAQPSLSGKHAWDSGASRRSSGSRSLRETLDSLAVLPFVNASGDPQTDYLSDGITETIINTLSRLGDLRVMARSTVFRYKDRALDPQTVGAALGVRGVLAGRVLWRGENLIVKAELVDAADGSLLWAESFQRLQGDIFELEAELAKQITEHLRLRLTGEQAERLVKRYTDNTEAYHLYLKGRFFWNQRSPEALRKAIECFLQAIKKDNQYALAYAGLTDCYTLLSWAAVPPREFVPKARMAVMKALEIDGQLAEAHASFGFLTLWYDWDFLKAEQEFLCAIELNPNLPTAHHWYGYSLVVQERIDEGLERMRHALSLDPLSLIITTDIGEILYRARRYDAALAQLQKAIEMDANFQLAYSWRAVCLLKLGRAAEVVSEVEQKLSAFGSSPGRKTALAVACVLTNDRRRAQMLFEQLQQETQYAYVPPYYLACIAANLGNLEQAFAYLERAYQERSGWIPWLKLDPMADMLRHDVRFSELLRRVGLMP